MRVGIYLRVSTDGQTTENQRRDLMMVCALRGWTDVTYFVDEGISGSKGRDKRPGFDAMLEAVERRELDIVASWSMDRLSRSIRDLLDLLENLREHGCELYMHQQQFDTSTPTGELMFTILGAFAQFERRTIRERVKSGMARAKSQGKKFGAASPYTDKESEIAALLQQGKSMRYIAGQAGCSTSVVQRVKGLH